MKVLKVLVLLITSVNVFAGDCCNHEHTVKKTTCEVKKESVCEVKKVASCHKVKYKTKYKTIYKTKYIDRIITKPVIKKIVKTKKIYIRKKIRKNSLSLIGLHGKFDYELTDNDRKVKQEYKQDVGLMYQRDFTKLRMSLGGTLGGSGFIGAGINW